MTFDEFKKLIPQHLDGEFQDVENKEFVIYVKDHPKAQREVDAFKKSWAMLDEWKDIEPQPGYESRFWTELTSRKSLWENITAVFRNLFYLPKLVPAAITACLLVVFGVLTFQIYNRTQPEQALLANLDEQDYELVEYLELAENLDFFEDMEFFEDYDIIENLPYEKNING